MKAIHRRKIGRFWCIWVICPICASGRWVQESRVGVPRFTGRCQKCYLKIAKQEMALYYPPKS